MSITFRCEQCRKDVKAPDAAAGKRGKCPHCGHSSYIPMPSTENEEIPLAPIDEEEGGRGGKSESFQEMDRTLLHEMSGAGTEVPLDHREDLGSEDLHHFVVNYCLDMFKGDLERAAQHAQKMKTFKYTAIQAVEDFEKNNVTEMVLDVIPKKVLNGFLLDLKERLSS